MTPDELKARLQALIKRPIQLKITESSTYASVAREPGGRLSLSLHRLFLHAPTPVLEALARFAVRPNPEARAVIRQMVHLFFTTIEPPVSDASLSNPKGVCVDLQEFYDRANMDYFGGGIDVPISWFEAPCYRKFRHITFGVFDRTLPLIRINRLLDQSAVPRSFVEFIVYHEMLHVVCPAHLDKRGRLMVHTAEFKRREAEHPFYLFSKEWSKQSLRFFKRLHSRP